MDESQHWVTELENYLDVIYTPNAKRTTSVEDVVSKFPIKSRSALALLQTKELPAQPLYDLMEGFKVDLNFPNAKVQQQVNLNSWPIKSVSDLDRYGLLVAGTVAELCISLALNHYPLTNQAATRESIVQAGQRMGVALQYVNIARDISVDAELGRVYIPTSWLKDEGLTIEAVVRTPSGSKIDRLRRRLLERAFAYYEEARPALEDLPTEVRGPMRVAIESYMEIGRVLSERTGKQEVIAGRATVPKSRRILVAWKALSWR